ncbi:capsular exopolysaccharide family domain protein [Synechococcus sp. A18-40]|nr:capsular exopolysaccharide family domain protein [Synechococcus sp. A18-40]
MSNLVAAPGQSPDFDPRNVQTVRVREIDTNQPIGADDEIDLRELWRALQRRKKLVTVTAGSVIVLAALFTTYQRLFRPVYQGSFSLLITDPISNEGGGRSGMANVEGTMFEQLARNTTSNDIPTLIEVLQSPVLLQPVAEKYGLSTGGLIGRIEINSGGAKRKEAKGVLNVSLTGRDPIEDERLLKALSNTYLQAALQQRQQRLADGLAFLNKQAPSLQTRLDQLQGELADFRTRYSLLEPTAEGGALKQRETAMAAQVLGLEADRNRLLKVRGEIASGTLTARGFQEAIGNTGGGQANSGLTVSDVDQSLLQQLLKVETELAEARSRYNPGSSMVIGLEERLNQLRPLLRQNQLEAVDAALSLNAGRLATARMQQATLNQQFLQQPGLIKQYEALQQRLEIAKQNLAGLVSAREKFQLEIAQRTVPWRVIAEPTINPKPIKPSVPRNLALGTVLGLVAGAAAGLLRDRMDHVFHHAGEVKDDLGLPLLGHIPHVEFFKGVREGKRFLLQELDQSVTRGEDADTAKQRRYQRFFYQEAFRNLFTSIRFLNSDQPLRSIALTSSLPAEGKSLVNVLLAKTLSEMGQRVLLIDADLRKPQMDVRLGLNNLSGLSNVLTEDDQTWRDAVQTVPGYDNWSVLTAGRRPPDPTRLLSSNRMRSLVNELEQSGQFDLVLFDTPPVLGLADAALVAEHCDGLMLLVSLDRVDRSLPKESVSRIRSSGAPLLGIVTNALKPEKQSAAYGYGKYGYGKYGYGYGGYGGYGYGGYGYAAYDTSAAYAYYSNDEDETQSSDNGDSPTAVTNRKRRSLQPSSNKSGNADKAPNLRDRWRAQRQRLMKWLDN